jgi:hypothetical protein
MAIATTTLASIGLGLQAFSMIQQADAADNQAGAMRESTDASKRSEAAKARMAEVEAARQRVSQVREERIMRSQIIASAGNQGMGSGTSGVSGSVSSVRSQASANIGFIGQQETFAGQASAANQASADAIGRANAFQAEGAQWQQIGGLAGTVFKDKGGWATIFKGNTHDPAGSV